MLRKGGEGERGVGGRRRRMTTSRRGRLVLAFVSVFGYHISCNHSGFLVGRADNVIWMLRSVHTEVEPAWAKTGKKRDGEGEGERERACVFVIEVFVLYIRRPTLLLFSPPPSSPSPSRS